MKQIEKLKRELIIAIVSLILAAVGLSSATYAWYVANNKVTGSSATICATTNGFILQIATAENGVNHGGSQESLVAQTNGGKISPSSTDDLKNWYAFAGWNTQGKVTSYSKITFDQGEGALPGQYNDTYFAYIRSDYVLYTITETGEADVYLIDDGATPAIEVTRTTGDPDNQLLPESLRIGLVSYNLDSGEETLRLVYAPYNETGKGNDVTGIDGWTGVKNGQLQLVSYPYTYGTNYIDSNGKNRAATQSGDNFTTTSGAVPVVPNVGYDGVGFRVYIWLEGTDEQCVNNSEEEDISQFNVTVKLAGVATGN